MSLKLTWPSSAKSPALSAGEVHLWSVPIDGIAARDNPGWALLAEDERRRAERFRFEQPRDRFVAARAALRVLLARYLGCRPSEVSFVYHGLGKPSLDERAHGQPALRFNLAHSAGVAILAVTREVEIGVDVELLRPVRHAAGISQRFFHTDEAADVLAQPEQQLQDAFFRCWTRKEAVVKAIGTGLQFPLGGFRVPVLADEAAWVETPQVKERAASRYWLETFEPAPGYIGAVATLESACRCRFHALKA